MKADQALEILSHKYHFDIPEFIHVDLEKVYVKHCHKIDFSHSVHAGLAFYTLVLFGSDMRQENKERVLKEAIEYAKELVNLLEEK